MITTQCISLHDSQPCVKSCRVIVCACLIIELWEHGGISRLVVELS